MHKKHILIIDNYDSFTFNLYHLLRKVRGGYRYTIKRNRERSLFHIDCDALIVSPGPMGPEQTGFLKEFFLTVVIPGNIPVFGVCLGMQCIASFFGAVVDKSDDPVHGRRVAITHEGRDIFSHIKRTFYGMRYNSLEVTNLPADDFVILARQKTNAMIMALRHRFLPLCGVQFHPESFLTGYSYKLIENFFLLYVEHNGD
jgi:anthranilate synthase/aminodeoxychorismate synthase-like glutamine amidotransferase